MNWAVSDLSVQQVYKLLVNTVVPRPIALVTTLDRSGRTNAAPFSFFNVFSHAPALVVLGIERLQPDGEDEGRNKDTLNNIRRSGEFVINLVDRALLPAMNICGLDFPPDVDELEVAGLEHAASKQVRPPRIAASPVQLECRETMSLGLGQHGRFLVIGEVLQIWVKDTAIDHKMHIDIDQLDLVGRVHGRDWYVAAKDCFQAARAEMRSQAETQEGPPA